MVTQRIQLQKSALLVLLLSIFRFVARPLQSWCCDAFAMTPTLSKLPRSGDDQNCSFELQSFTSSRAQMWYCTTCYLSGQCNAGIGFCAAVSRYGIVHGGNGRHMIHR